MLKILTYCDRYKYILSSTSSVLSAVSAPYSDRFIQYMVAQKETLLDKGGCYTVKK